jgi:Tfp pilus assembly protein PilX
MLLQRFRPPRTPRHAQGFVLVVALILMGVMGILSTASIKLALQGDTVATGLRSVNLTSQAAEIALRWCELQARLADAGNLSGQVVVQGVQGVGTAAPALWQTVNTYQANAVNIPGTVMNSAGLTNFPVLPQCLVEFDHSVSYDLSSSSTAKSRVYLSTVRAFSPDYIRQGGDRIGSEVWLQSKLFVSY